MLDLNKLIIFLTKKCFLFFFVKFNLGSLKLIIEFLQNKKRKKGKKKCPEWNQYITH